MNQPPTGQSPFDVLGGDEAVRRLVDRFYDLMDLEPGYAGIRKLHPPSLDGSREKLYLFLSGWLGGPPLYQQRIGNPMLRARHLPFAIGVAERDAWLACMRQALAEEGVNAALQEPLMSAFHRTADWMRNQPDDREPAPGQPGYQNP